jgi:hypothetical protein
MSSDNPYKIQKVLQSWPAGTAAVSAWFSALGVSSQLLTKYLLSNWVTPLGKGAYAKTGETVSWQGGLYALQTQAKLPIHAGAMTALAMQGMAHYIRMGRETVFLFAPPKTSLPAWFKNHDWNAELRFMNTSVFPEDTGLSEHEEKTFSIRISAPERAMLECLHLAPDAMDLTECYQIMEGLTTLRPRILQPLLEQCGSIKVKRLFLYMADKAGHSWHKRLDVSKLELGSGHRTIIKGGVYVSRFGITVPEALTKL